MAMIRLVLAWVTHRYWLWRMARRWRRINVLITRAIAAQAIKVVETQGRWYQCPTCGLNWVDFDQSGIQGVVGMRQCGACELTRWRLHG